jgi:hypothetical protein
MTRPRKALISFADTPYYHITLRCVRRAFLCGVDHYSGQSHEHRRQWVVDCIRLLSSIFAIDVCAYSVMSNHYHLLLKVCPEQLEDLCEDDIMDRWWPCSKARYLFKTTVAARICSHSSDWPFPTPATAGDQGFLASAGLCAA